MKNPAFRWLITISFATLISWVFAKLVKYFVGFSGSASADILVIVDLFSFFTCLLFSLGLEMAVRWRKERDQAIKEMQSELLEKLEVDVKSAVAEGIGNTIFPIIDSTKGNRAGSHLFAMMNDVMQRNSSLHPDVFYAKLILLHEAFNGLNADLAKLTESGIWVDISGHLRVTRALLHNAPGYMQIQSNLTLTPEKWTVEWKNFLSEISEQKGLVKQYIFAGSMDEFKKNEKGLQQCRDYLKKLGFSVGFCDIAKYQDSVGRTALENSVIEFFSGEVIKAVKPQKGEYTGGKKVRMTITKQGEDLLRHGYILFVDKNHIEF